MKSMRLVLLAILAVTSAIKQPWRPCPVSVCSVCMLDRTICKTNESDPFPQKLDPNTQMIWIEYEGKRPLKLNASMLDRYTKLQALRLSGNINEIQELTFARATNLEHLEIENSKLTYLHQNCFGNKTNLKSLHLTQNSLMTKIPFEIFKNLPELKDLILAYSGFEICHGETIGEQFYHLTSLKKLNLVGLGDPESCKNISSRFLEPVSGLVQLNLSESAVLHGDQTLLMTMPKLNELYLNNLEPYKQCPSKVKVLLENLPSKMKYLHTRSWRSEEHLIPECVIGNATFAGLMNLNHLNTLDFEYSDRMFGNVIRRDVFQYLHQVLQINVGWCRITEIEEGALTGFNLSSLQLQGNPIGPQAFWVSGRNQTMLRTGQLVLKNCMINCDEVFRYDISYIFQQFPRLDELDLSRNILFTLPKFTLSGTNFTSPVKLNLNLGQNALTELKEQDMHVLCQSFPNFDKLYVPRNYITTIELLCPSLKLFNADKNPLVKNRPTNFRAIKRLTQLRTLSLDDTELTDLPPDLFSSMKHLRNLHLLGNNLTTLNPSQFSENAELRLLDLSKNNLVRFDSVMVTNMKRLESLFFRSNKITVFSKDFLKYVDKTKSLQNLRIDDNSFDCTCDHFYFQTWVNNSTQLHHADELKCLTPETLRGKPIISYHQPLFDCYLKWVAIGLAGLVGLILSALVIYRLRWYLSHLRYVALSVAERLREIKQQDQCKYDAMVIFNSKSDNDTNWVKKLMIELEGGDYPQPINLNNPDGRVSV